MAETDGLQGLGRKSALGFAGALVNGIATIASILIASKALSNTEVGQFFVAISVFALAQGICSLGIETGLQYWIPAITPESIQRILRMALGGAAALGLVAMVVVGVGAGPIGRMLGDSKDQQLPGLLRAVALLLPCAGVYEVAYGALRSSGRMFASVLVDRIIRPVIQIIGLAVCAIGGGGSLAMTMAWTGPFVLATVAALYLLMRTELADFTDAERRSIDSAEFWVYTKPRAVARIAQVVTQRVDVLLIAGLASVEDAGVYGTVSRCMIAGVFVATAVQQVVQPRLRKLVVKGELRAVKTMYEASTTWLVLATWPAYLAMGILSPFVLRMFGPEYVRGATALTILSLTMLVASGCGLVDVVLLMVGKSWLSTGIVCAALGLNAALNVLLIPRLGMNGAAIAWSVAILTTNLVPLFVVSRLGLHPAGRALSTAIAVALLCFAVPLAAGRLASSMSSFDALLTLAIAGGAYVAALAVTRRAVLLDRFLADLTSRPPRARAPRTTEVTLT
jgi:O-antigen/teichoic acid export membrane protein